MSKPKVYVETTFVSYLTARPSQDAITAGHQQASQRWWDTQRERFELCTSQRVIQEAGVGDVEMAKARLSVLAAMTLLETTESALALAKRLVGKGVMPIKAAEGTSRGNRRRERRRVLVDVELQAPGERDTAQTD